MNENIQNDSQEPFEWLISEEFNWWYQNVVLQLEVGESTETDFQQITRVK